MQNNLQEWDKQLEDIIKKKTKNGKAKIQPNCVLSIYNLDSVCSTELASRDQKLKDLNEKYSSEHKIRVKTEKQKDKLVVKLVSTYTKFLNYPLCFTSQRDTEEELTDHKQQVLCKSSNQFTSKSVILG